MWDGSPLNITIKAVNGSDGSGRIIITGILLYPIELYFMTLKVDVTDNGIGMTPEEMTRNLVCVFSSVDICAANRVSKREPSLNPGLQIFLCKLRATPTRRPIAT